MKRLQMAEKLLEAERKRREELEQKANEDSLSLSKGFKLKAGTKVE